MKEKNDLANYPRDQFPNYFGLFANKNIMLSDIRKENPNLCKAVQRLIENGAVVEIKVNRLDGVEDSIVHMRREESNRPLTHTI